MNYLLLFIIVFLLIRYFSYLISNRANKTQHFHNSPSPNSATPPKRFKDAVDAEFEVIEDENKKRA